ARLPQPGQRPGPAVHPGPGHPQDVAGGHPDAAPVERVGGRRVDQHGVDAEGGRVAEQGAEVLVVVEALGQDDEPGALEQLAGCREGQPVGRGQHAPVDVEPGGRRALLVVADDHRGPPGDEPADPLGLAPGGEHRAHGVRRLEQRLQRHHPLGHEEATVPLDGAAPGRVVQVPVVLERVAPGHAAILPAGCVVAALGVRVGRGRPPPAARTGHPSPPAAPALGVRALRPGPGPRHPRRPPPPRSGPPDAATRRPAGPRAGCWRPARPASPGTAPAPAGRARRRGPPPPPGRAATAPCPARTPPAARVVPLVTGRSVRTRLVPTAASTATPASTDSVRGDTTATTAAPTTVPGSRPAISQATADRSTPRRSRRTMPTASGRTSSMS